ncbi:MAG: hypothetical protein ACE5FK_05365 [Candidatus Methylomirabilia bacterium]
MASLLELIERARALSAERDRLEEALAQQWATALRGQPVSAQDREELWAGLAEEAIRWLLKQGPEQWAPERVRQEAVEVIGRVKERVERALAESRDGSGNIA